MMTNARRVGLAATSVVLVAAAAATLAAVEPRAVQNAGASALIDRVFEVRDRRDSPGCALALYQDGTIAYERGYGMADLEHDVPSAPDTVFYVGSLSRQFTAFAAALAIQRGRPALGDSIRKYLPELPDRTAPITVRHLIHARCSSRDAGRVV